MKKAGTPFRNRFVAHAAVALTSYLLGGLAHEKQFFPFDYFWRSENALAEDHLSAPAIEPRITMFEAFSPNADIVMIGDSITQAGEWREIFPNRNIANRGVAGDTTDDILNRMPTIAAVQASKAFVMAGVNDFLVGRSVEDVYTNLVRIVTRLQTRGMTVFLQSTLECSRSVCGGILESIRLLNHRLAEYASTNGLSYIDINQNITSARDGLLSQYSYDGIHLLGGGYLAWRDTLEPYISQ